MTGHLPFSCGQLYITRGALAHFGESNGAMVLLARHLRCDWGDLCAEDKRLNDDALKNGDRILSAYVVNDEKVYIITECDRSMTTVLMADEY